MSFRFLRPRVFLVTVALLAVTAVGLSTVFAFVLTGPQRRTVPPLPADFGFPVEKISFESADGIQLRGWFVPSHGAKRGVVLLHGNGSTRGQMLARAHLLRSWGYSALLYDARGHGESGGTLVSVGWHEQQDLLAALDFLRRQGCTELGCLGASQGGATIALAAAKLPEVSWIVLESVYPDIATALDRRFQHYLHLPGWLVGSLMMPIAEWRLGVSAGQIAPRKTISKLRCPVLIMGGNDDHYTTRDDTLKLFDAAAKPKELWLVPDAQHVDLYGFARETYAARLREFVRTNWSELREANAGP